MATSTAEKIVQKNDGIRFAVHSYSDGRNKPYEVSSRLDGVRSSYKFTAAGDDSTEISGCVDVRVGSEIYKARYRRNGRLRTVKLVSSERRRNLLRGDEGETRIYHIPYHPSRLRTPVPTARKLETLCAAPGSPPYMRSSRLRRSVL